MSGCPCNILFTFLNVTKFSFGKYPLSQSTAYKALDACPFDKTNLSRDGSCAFSGSIFISLKYNTVKTSAIDNDPPGCPDFA